MCDNHNMKKIQYLKKEDNKHKKDKSDNLGNDRKQQFRKNNKKERKFFVITLMIIKEHLKKEEDVQKKVW